MSSESRVQFPGESEAYRHARDELLRAELGLRRRIEHVAQLRRQLPLSGEIPEDYLFEEGAPGDDLDAARPVPMSRLFAPGKDSLILYSFMFGPDMPNPCPLCTSLLDGLDGTIVHARERIGFAVVAKSPISRIRSFARERGWRDLRLLSSANNAYNRDYHAETPEGSQLPALNVFVRRGEKVHHFYNAELLYAPTEGTSDPRHVDSIWPFWNLFDLTPEGRGGDWVPKLWYP